jgi:xylulokinase
MMSVATAPYYIGLDLGTSASKGVLYCCKRNAVLARSSCPVHHLRTPDGRDEITPESYWQDTWDLTASLAAQSPAPVRAIACCAASGNTLVCTADGRAKSPIISWLDCRKLPAPCPDIHDLVGWPWNGGFTLAHLLWLKEHQPELFGPDSHYCMNNDWVQYRLCGHWALDYSSATPSFLQDQKNRCYHRAFLQLLGIGEQQLSPLCPSGTRIGYLRPELCGPGLSSGTAIVSGSFDHPCAARAVQVLQEGELLLSCGSSWVGFQPQNTRTVRPGHLLDPFLRDRSGPWGSMVSLSKIGVELEEWICVNFGSDAQRYERFNAAACSGDGPARRLMQETFRRFQARLGDIPVRRLTMVGGPSEGAGWRDVAREVLSAEIVISEYSKEAGAVGAALLAAQGTEQ